MEKELTNLEEKEEDQSAKTPNSAFKITKAEEAIVKTIKFYCPATFLSLIKTPYIAKPNKAELAVLFRPPIA